MAHRHIDPKGWTLAKIDDVIGYAGLPAWLELRDAARTDPSLIPKIRRIASHGATHGEDIDAYRFWLIIADDLERDHKAKAARSASERARTNGLRHKG